MKLRKNSQSTYERYLNATNVHTSNLVPNGNDNISRLTATKSPVKRRHRMVKWLRVRWETNFPQRSFLPSDTLYTEKRFSDVERPWLALPSTECTVSCSATRFSSASVREYGVLFRVIRLENDRDTSISKVIHLDPGTSFFGRGTRQFLARLTFLWNLVVISDTLGDRVNTRLPVFGLFQIEEL